MTFRSIGNRYPDQDTYYSRAEGEITYSAHYRRDGTARLRIAGRVPGVSARDQIDTLHEYVNLDFTNHWTPAISFGEWDRLGFHQPDYVQLDPAKADTVRYV